MSLAGPFLFDPRAFWGDENVRKMTGEQVAAYLRLLSLQWEEGSIPADLAELAMLLTDGARHYGAAEFEAEIWPALAPCFEVLNRRSTDVRLVNKRLHKERTKWLYLKRTKSEAGVASGKARRAASRKKSESKAANTRSTEVRTKDEQNANLSSSSSSSLIRERPTEVQSKRPDPIELSETWERFEKAYPPSGMTNLIAVQRAFFEMAVLLPPGDELIAILERYKQSARWKDDGGRFIPNAENWLRKGAFKKPPPADGNSRPAYKVLKPHPTIAEIEAEEQRAGRPA